MLWLNCFGILWEILPQAIILFSQCLPALYRLIHILQIESLLECFSIKLVISDLVQCAMCVTFLLGQKAVINDRPQKVLIVPIWWTVSLIFVLWLPSNISWELVISDQWSCTMCVTFLQQKPVINDRPQKVLIVRIWWTNQRGKSLIKASHSSCPETQRKPSETRSKEKLRYQLLHPTHQKC